MSSCEKYTLQPQQQQPQQQQQQTTQQAPVAAPPPAGAAAPPIMAAPTPSPNMMAAQPLVYQQVQLPGGQIQMYQLPPGYVPVLVSNTGSLQPLVSLQQQQSLEVINAQNTLAVPQDSNGGRRSSNPNETQPQVYVQQQPPPAQQLIYPQQQMPQQHQQVPQPVPQQHVVEQPQVVMLPADQAQQFYQQQQQPQQVYHLPPQEPQQVYQQPQEPPPPQQVYQQHQEAPQPIYQPVHIEQQPIYQQPQMTILPHEQPQQQVYQQVQEVPPQPVYQHPVQEPTPVVYQTQHSDPTVMPQQMVEAAAGLPPHDQPMEQQYIYPPANEISEDVNRHPDLTDYKPPPSPLPPSVPVGVDAATTAVGGALPLEVADDEEFEEDQGGSNYTTGSQGVKDVSWDHPPTAATGLGVGGPSPNKTVTPSSHSHICLQDPNAVFHHPTLHVVQPNVAPTRIVYQHQSISLDPGLPPSHQHILSHKDAAAQFRKSSVPNTQMLNSEAFLRRGSLPPLPSILLAKSSGTATSSSSIGTASLASATSSLMGSFCSAGTLSASSSYSDLEKIGNMPRRSSSGAIVPLATLREKADSDISLEDLSQVK